MRSTGAYLDKSLLPPPAAFYARELTKIGRKNAKGWAPADCPFHKSHTHRSLSVNLDTGGYHCFGCGAHGDMLGFLRQRYHLSYWEARRELGVSTDGIRPQMARRIAQQRIQEQHDQAEHDRQERRRRIDARERLRGLEAVWEAITARFEDEAIFYDFLTDLLNEIREAEFEYGRYLERSRYANGLRPARGER
jgi:DNA primase